LRVSELGLYAEIELHSITLSKIRLLLIINYHVTSCLVPRCMCGSRNLWR